VSRGWWTLTLLVAGRELRERVSARSFRISTIILVIGVACAVGIPALVSGGGGPGKVGIVGPDQAALAATVRQAGSVLGEKVEAVPFTSQAAGEAQLRKGKLDALYVGGRAVLIKQEPAQGASDTTARFAGAIAQLARAPSPQASSTSRPLPVRGLKRAPTSLSTRLTGIAVVVLIYLLIFIYGWVRMANSDDSTAFSGQRWPITGPPITDSALRRLIRVANSAFSTPSSSTIQIPARASARAELSSAAP
jgi:hypothetical protein